MTSVICLLVSRGTASSFLPRSDVIARTNYGGKAISKRFIIDLTLEKQKLWYQQRKHWSILIPCKDGFSSVLGGKSVDITISGFIKSSKLIKSRKLISNWVLSGEFWTSAEIRSTSSLQLEITSSHCEQESMPQWWLLTITLTSVSSPWQ